MRRWKFSESRSQPAPMLSQLVAQYSDNVARTCDGDAPMSAGSSMQHDLDIASVPDAAACDAFEAGSVAVCEAANLHKDIFCKSPLRN